MYIINTWSHDFSRAIWNKLALVNFSTRPTGACNFVILWKNLLVLIYSKLHSKSYDYLYKLRICSCLACVYRVIDARGKFGEHEKCVRVARGEAESNSSFLSALQTSRVHHNSIYAQLKAWTNSFITERQQECARRSLLLW